MVLVNPDGYEVGLRMVRWIADRIGELSSTDELVDAYERRSELLAQASSSLSLSPSEALSEVIVDAAFLGGHRQLVDKIQQNRARELIAQSEGVPGWLKLVEVGIEGNPGYRRLDIRLPDGLGLHWNVSHDPETYRPVFAYECLRLDPHTGDVLTDGAPGDRVEFTDKADWLAAVGAILADS